MKKEKTHEEILEEFIAKGGIVEKIPYVEPKENRMIGSFSKKAPELLTLEEAELLYGQKQEKKKTIKKPDLSGIDMNLIPEHLRKLFTGSEQDDTTKENDFEAD